MKQSEKLVEKTLVSEIKKVGGLSIKMLVVNFAGFPDRLCLLPGGRAFFVECKTTGRGADPIQKYVHEKLKRMGQLVFMCDSTEDAKNIVRAVTEEY